MKRYSQSGGMKYFIVRRVNVASAQSICCPRQNTTMIDEWRKRPLRNHLGMFHHPKHNCGEGCRAERMIVRVRQI